jgi:serine/threonine protein kinase
MDIDNKNSQNIKEESSSQIKRVPYVMILPDGTKPEILGSGTITSLLGVGGMANVYEIWNQKLEVKRAVKLLHPNYSLEAKERFETEVRITAKLDHPNIVEIHAVGEWNGLPYIEMEKIEGITLEKLIEERGSLPFEVATSIGIMICRALRYAHNLDYVLYGKNHHGIIHRDLKPNNIMVTNNGNVKLMDFGIARPIDASLHTTDNASVMGTMQYLPPELLEGKSADLKTDIYSLGAVLYEMVTGKKAFDETNISKLMMAKIKNDYRPLESFNLKIPSKLKKLINQCLNRDKEKRPVNADYVLTELTKIHKSLTLESPESVMLEFMGKSAKEKKVLNARFHISKNFIYQYGLVFFLIISGLFLLWLSIIKKHEKEIAQTPAHPDKITLKKEETKFNSPPLEPSKIIVDAKKNIVDNKKQKKVSVNNINIKRNIEPAKKQEIVATLQTSFIDEVKNKYGTDDLLEIFVKLIKLSKYDDALKLYEYIPQEIQNTKTFILYKIRLMQAINNIDELKTIFLEKDINDCEFYLAKAKYFYKLNDINKCLANIELATKYPCELLDQTTFRQEILYYKALCYSKEFDSNPDKTNMKKALDTWFEVKSIFRAMPDHKYYKEAEKEMQRIAQKSQG